MNLLKKSTSLFVVQILNWVYFFQINLQGLLGCFSRCAYACLSLELKSKQLTRNEPGAFQMIWTITAILKLDVICNAAHLEGISLRDSWWKNRGKKTYSAEHLSEQIFLKSEVSIPLVYICHMWKRKLQRFVSRSYWVPVKKFKIFCLCILCS